MLLIGSCNGFFRALEKDTGKERWGYDTKQDGGPAEFHGDPLLAGEIVVVGSDQRKPGGAGYLYAFDWATGKPRWKYPAGPGVMTDIQRIGSNIYAVTLNDELVSLDLETGDANWKFATGESNLDFLANSSPAVEGDRVFFGGRGGAVYALDAYSGQVLWKQEMGARVSTSVTLMRNGLYVGASNGYIYRLNPKTGAVLAKLTTDQPPGGQLVPAGDSLLVFFGEETLACVDASLQRIRWSQTSSAPWTSSRPYLWGSAVLAGNKQGDLFVFRPTDGSRLKSGKLEGAIRGIGTSENVLYIGTLKGMVYAWSPGNAPEVTRK